MSEGAATRATEVARLINQVERAVGGDAWHGDPVLEVLARVPFAKAGAKPASAAHSIRDIVRHMTAWTHEVRRRLNGEVAAEPPGGDWPPPQGDDQAAWRAEVAAFQAANDALLADLRGFDDARLLEPITDRRQKNGKGVTRYVLLHGLVQHHAYHSGQIAILAKF